MKLIQFRKGQIAIVMTLAMATLLGVMALGADVGVMYYNWGQIQKAADAAALAGASYLLPPTNGVVTLPTAPTNAGCSMSNTAENVACAYAYYNYATAADISNGGIYYPAQTVPTGVSAANAVQVTLTRTNIPVFFLRMLGRTNQYSASATATALQPQAVTEIKNGMLPIGMPPNPLNNCPVGQVNGCLSPGTQFSLTATYGPGNWGFLNIPTGWNDSMPPSNSGGQQLLHDNIVNGCTCDIKVGDQIDTQTGVGWGPTSADMAQIGVTSTNNPMPSTLTGTEPQLVTVPIVNWGNVNGASAVTVLGFAKVWIDSYSKSGSTLTMNVQFVNYILTDAINGSSSGNQYTGYTPAKLVL
jgi:hypothetical protein